MLDGVPVANLAVPGPEMAAFLCGKAYTWIRFLFFLKGRSAPTALRSGRVTSYAVRVVRGWSRVRVINQFHIKASPMTATTTTDIAPRVARLVETKCPRYVTAHRHDEMQDPFRPHISLR